jgi:site-specific DNA recombinase
LEALLDLAAEAQIAAALIYSPDRLSRKYACQVLLSEELARCGVELISLQSSAGTAPEDQLLVQFQGMIAEYERAQIAERCRRGKRHVAQRGGVNVLSGAPYGYRYVRKSDTSPAFYEVIEAEARVVRMVLEIYTQQGLSINAIARLLNERQIATRTGKGRWERSTVWGMLRQPCLSWNRMLWQNHVPGNESRARCDNGRACRAVIVRATNDRARSGLRCRYLRG